MVGFVEEGIFRGLMLHALKPSGPWKAAVITTLLFGMTHALNALAGKSILENALQIVYAVAIGFAYAALALRKGILWPLVLAHFSIDLVSYIQPPGFTFSTFWTVTIAASLAAVLTVYGLFVMLQRRETGGGGADGGRVSARQPALVDDRMEATDVLYTEAELAR